jgi:hypothetical protein
VNTEQIQQMQVVIGVLESLFVIAKIVGIIGMLMGSLTMLAAVPPVQERAFRLGMRVALAGMTAVGLSWFGPLMIAGMLERTSLFVVAKPVWTVWDSVAIGSFVTCIVCIVVWLYRFVIHGRRDALQRVQD